MHSHMYAYTCAHMYYLDKEKNNMGVPTGGLNKDEWRNNRRRAVAKMHQCPNSLFYL